MNTSTTARRVERVWKGTPTLEGAGVHLKRVFGFHELGRLDPFLMMDFFGSENPADYRAGFPWHPHRGIETITYILDGDVEHQDSMGNVGVISSGDIQWMTAGSGIIHQEMPLGDRRGRMYGFQLWANLPASGKMMDPRYQEVKQGQIPQVRTPDGATVRVIAGEVAGVRGPVQGIVTDPEMLDVSLPAGKTFVHGVKPGHTVFAYVMEGKARFDPGPDFPGYAGTGEVSLPLGEGNIVLYGPGDTVLVTADHDPVRFLLLAGQPLHEPIAWHGPIVMNTQDELLTAVRELREGSFVKHAGR